MTVTGPHFGFPGVCHLGGGELLAFARDGSGHGGTTHALRSWRSTDYGATWAQDTDVRTGDPGRDPTAMVTSVGTVVVLAFPNVSNGNAVSCFRSTDNGATWSAPITVYQDAGNRAACSGPPVQLADGTLVAPVYVRENAGTYWSSVVAFSNDDGATWGSPVTVADGPADSSNFQEPNLLLLASGTLACFHRTTDGAMKRNVSTDNGATWSTPEVVLSGVEGRPHVVQATDGTVLCFNRPSDFTRRGVYYASADGGVTFGPQGVFTEVGRDVPGPAGWHVYAQAVEVAANDFVVVFANEAWLFSPRITKAS